MEKIIWVSLLLVLSTTPSFAVDLINKDQKSYDVEITTLDGTTKTTIAGQTVKNNICSGKCEIEVKGVGTINASTQDKIIIQNGQIKRE